MRRLALTAAVACVALVLPLRARAGEINFGALDKQRPNMVHLRGGAEYAFVAGIGYSRVFRARERPWVVTANLTLPIANPDFGDFRVRGGLQVPVVSAKGWTLVGRVVPLLRSFDNAYSRMVNLGMDFGVLGGYYARRWFLAGELGIDWAMATWIKHKDAYRENVYAGARDGWYSTTGGNFYYGLMGGYSFAPVDLILRVGQPRSLANARTWFLPLYATLSINVRFGDAKPRRPTAGGHSREAAVLDR